MKIDAFVGPAASLHELCMHEGHDFIRAAYLTVLGRLPDEGGFAFYLSQFDQGVSKLTILSELRTSLEARNYDPGIAGFDRALKRHRRGNFRLIGGAFRLFTKVERETPAARNRRALLRRLERLETRLMEVHADLSERLDGRAAPRRKFGIMPATKQSAEPWALDCTT